MIRNFRSHKGKNQGESRGTRALFRIPVRATRRSSLQSEEAISAEGLTAALFARFRSRQEHTFAEKMLSARRNKIGGHVEIYPVN